MCERESGRHPHNTEPASWKRRRQPSVCREITKLTEYCQSHKGQVFQRGVYMVYTREERPSISGKAEAKAGDGVRVREAWPESAAAPTCSRH